MPTPSLLLVPARFKTGRLYSQIPTNTDNRGDFTVTRNTAARRVNSAGLIESVASGIPRLDYFTSDGVTGCPALLVEPSGTNLYQQSEDFSNAYWSKVNCVASGNLAIAPDGNLTADKLIMGNGILPNVANQSGLARSETVTSSAYRFSIFAKSAEFTGFRVRENLSNGTFLDVNLTNGAITNGDVTQFINPLAENYGNGWYRISWTSPTITSLTKYSIRVGSTGDGVSGIFVWGAQLETGSVATSYIPTTTGTGSRSEDVISVTGAVSGSIGQTAGTLYIEFVQNNNVSLNRIIAIDNGTNSDNGFDIVTTAAGNIRITYRVLGVAQCDITTSVVTAVGVAYKVAFAYSQNDFVIYVNGIERGTDSSGNTTLTPSRIILGGRSDATGNVRARAAALYTTRLTNAELASLTAP